MPDDQHLPVFVGLHMSGPCRGGLRFGALAGTFVAVQQLSSIARAERGAADVLVAGTLTGAIFGATGTRFAWMLRHVHDVAVQLCTLNHDTQMSCMSGLHYCFLEVVAEVVVKAGGSHAHSCVKSPALSVVKCVTIGPSSTLYQFSVQL